MRVCLQSASHFHSFRVLNNVECFSFFLFQDSSGQLDENTIAADLLPIVTTFYRVRMCEHVRVWFGVAAVAAVVVDVGSADWLL